jgi:RHS repeat-associated protein
MKKLDASAFTSVIRAYVLILCTACCASMLWTPSTAVAQDTYTTTTSATNGSTPAALAPGTPAGSYALSGFESVNPFSGALGFHLPLVHVGGRGQVGYTITLNIERKWRMQRTATYTALQGVVKPGEDQLDNESYFPLASGWNTLDPAPGPNYIPGYLVGRMAGDGIQSCAALPQKRRIFQKTLERLTFTEADGTEYELRDTATHGQVNVNPLDTSCDALLSRGRVFETEDGSSATFIADPDQGSNFQVYDNVDISFANDPLTPSGYLYLRDGTRYRIDNGVVTSMRDRNGNEISFSGDLITDAAGRKIRVSPSGISFLDTAGNTRKTIQVNFAWMDTVLRPDFSILNYTELFPGLDASPTDFNDLVVSSVVLPNGQTYQFKYNSYGELARVVLPTGGAIEYDYAAGVVGADVSGVVWQTHQIYRRVVERRVYPNGGSGNTYESRTTYPRPEHTNPDGTIGNDGVVTVDHLDLGQNLLAEEKHYYFGSAAISFANVIGNPTLYPDFKEGKEYKTEEGSPALRRVENVWGQNTPVSWWVGSSDQGPANNPHITDSTVTLLDTNQVSAQHYDYDQYNNKTTVKEYDYGSGAAGSLIRCTSSSYLASGYDTVNPNPVSPDPNSTAHLRSLVTNQSIYAGNCGTGLLQAQTQYGYDTGVIVSSGATQHDASWGTSYTTRGNVTAVQRWLNGTWLTTSHQYDDAGNVVRTIDPMNNSTTFSYADMWGNSGCAPSSGNAAAYRTTSTTPATPNVPGGLVTHYSYDSCRDNPSSTSNPNGQATSYLYNDPLDRPTQVTFPEGGGTTSFTYNDSLLNVETLRDLDTANDHAMRTKTVYDGLGRVIQTQLESDPQGIVYTDTTYDGLGRKHTVSNPYRSTSDPTYGLTTFGYDGLSRVKTVTTSDNAVVRTDYSGNQTTVTDQAGKPRRSLTDALGRLTRVDEPNKDTGALGDVTSPVQPTSYSYDALDDLQTVTQGGQTRSFSYDSLKRLTSATNPESGTVNYTSYDGNGNLLSKTDARGITTYYVYDALNRLTNKTYQNDPSSTPAVSYTYDATSVSNSKGRLTQVGSTVSTTNYTGYDAMGRVTASSQTTNGQTYLLGYGYNLAGGMTSETYPSGRTVSTGYDTAGRVNGVTGSGSKTYASTFTYWPHGAVNSITLGNNLIETTVFGPRLQPTSIAAGTLLSLVYNYGTTNNNGNVVSQGIAAGSFSATQNYGYDALNRLTSASEGSNWTESYGYDQYGNRTSVSVSSSYLPTYAPAPSMDASNKNRFATSASFGYDNAGNLTQGPVAPGGATQTFGYDAENKLVNFNSGTATYAYDGDGRRVMKVMSSSTTIFIYDATGKLIAEYANTAATGSGTKYITADHLGSTRLVTDATGAVLARHDYLPFGEDIPALFGNRSSVTGYNNSDDTKQKFTAKERDSESGLDYFGARYFSSGVGRFESADTFNNKLLQNPQDLNLYVYTINNPLRYVDPNGRDWKDYARGISQGVQNFAVNTYTGLKVAVQHPSTIVTGTVDALKTAGQAYLTSGGRSQLAAQFSSLSTKEKTAVITEAVTQGVVAALLTKGIGSAAKAMSGGEASTAVATEAEVTTGINASTPVGRLSSPMEIIPGTNTPETINGVEFSGHALDRMQSNGLVPSVVQDTLNNGAPGPGNTPGTATLTTNQLKVVINSDKKVVTVTPQ